MTEKNKPREVNNPLGVNRLTTTEFLSQLDAAADWMLWFNSLLGEIELCVKDSDEKLSFFHGPDPMTTDTKEYKIFCAEVEKISDEKAE